MAAARIQFGLPRLLVWMSLVAGLCAIMRLVHYELCAMLVSLISFTLLVLVVELNRHKNKVFNLSREIGAFSFIGAACIAIAFVTECVIAVIMDSGTQYNSWEELMDDFGRVFAMVILSCVFFGTFLLLGTFALAYRYWQEKNRRKN